MTTTVKDMKGKKIGKLEVLRRSNKKDLSGKVYWICKCACGRELPIRGDRLRNRKDKTCGKCKQPVDVSVVTATLARVEDSIVARILGETLVNIVNRKPDKTGKFSSKVREALINSVMTHSLCCATVKEVINNNHQGFRNARVYLHYCLLYRTLGGLPYKVDDILRAAFAEYERTEKATLPIIFLLGFVDAILGRVPFQYCRCGKFYIGKPGQCCSKDCCDKFAAKE